MMWWQIVKNHQRNPKGFVPFCSRVLPETRKRCNIEKEDFFINDRANQDWCKACKRDTTTTFAPSGSMKPRWSETSRNPNSPSGKRKAEEERKDKEYGSLREFDTGES